MDRWVAANDTQKVMANLGSHCTRLPLEGALARDIEGSSLLGHLERAYASINKVTL